MSDEDTLRREVFLLAYHLHWAPDTVLGLPSGDRRGYIRLLEEQLDRERQAARDVS